MKRPGHNSSPATPATPPVPGHRTDAIKSKFRSLTPEQRQALLGWLNQEKVTYRVALDRLKTQFGISLAPSSMCRWWKGKFAPCPPRTTVPPLLDVVIESQSPVRLTIHRRGEGISVQQKTLSS